MSLSEYICAKYEIMKCGIVGLPNVGKSTLFNCLSNAKAQAANFPFCTIEPNVGTVNVPDSRLQMLESLVLPDKVVPATVEIVDIAGLVKGASKGEGLGNQFLGNIRECNAILHVLRCFDNDNIIHVDGSVDPIRDKETIDIELQLKDLESIEKRLDKVRKISKTGDKDAMRETEMADRLKKFIESGKSVRSFVRTEEESRWITNYQLITDKPILYVCNVDEMAAKNGNHYVDEVKIMASKEGSHLMHLAVAIEADIVELDDYEERSLFLDDMGLDEPGVNRIIRAAYSMLNLQTYFTAGVKEVRAWTIENGFTAPQSAGVIHSDFEKGFIRAEVISYSDYIEFKNEIAVKEAGKMRVEGKEYLVQDGDVVHFRFNV
ncbi:MAG: Ribosome-binding ATPase YchF [Owenweeksia sp. TMED14]|nr:MAG: Ribosome-binding ATPase YchF [Owenweeksia sp. TMED14]